MKLKENASEYNLVSATAPITASTLASRYEFDFGSLGLIAKTQIGMIPDEIFNADADLTVEVNTNTWGLKKVKFDATGYMMTSIEERQKTPVKVNGLITYDHPAETLDAALSIDIKVPQDDPIFTSLPNGIISFHASPGLWNLKFGEPLAPIGIKINSPLGNTQLSGYFMTGMELPGPADLPPEILALGFESTMADDAISGGNGLAFGARLDIDLLDIDITVAQLWLNVKAGFDVSVLDYSAMTCNGKTDFGINNWYTNGQGYLLGNAGLTVADLEIANATAAVVVEGGFPAPMGVNGRVVLDVENFFKDFTVDQTFELGEICKMEPIPGPDGIAMVVHSPVEEMDFIERIVPGSMANSQDLWTIPEVVFAVDPFEDLEFSFSNGMGEVYEEEIRFHHFIDWEVSTDGVNFEGITFDQDWDEETLTMSLTAKNDPANAELQSGLRANTTYRVTASMQPQVRNAQNQWEPMVYTRADKVGDLIKEERIHLFTTGNPPTEIEMAHVDFCRPFDRQRYVTPADYTRAHMQFKVSYADIFDGMVAENNARFEAHFYNQSTGFLEHTEEISYPRPRYTYFNMPALKQETIYKVVFKAISDIPFPSNYSPELSGPSVNINEPVDTDISDQVGITANASNLDASGLGGFANSGYGSYASTNLNNTNNYGNSNTVSDFSDQGGISISDINVDIPQEYHREMYHWYFKTSKYASLQEKLETYTISGHEVQEKNAPQSGVYGLSYATTYTRIKVDFDGGEPFDEFDIHGHPYSTGNFSNRVVGVGMNQGTEFHGWSADAKKIGCLDPLAVVEVLEIGGSSTDPSNGPTSTNTICNTSLYRQISQIEGTLSSFEFTNPYIKTPLTDQELGLDAGFNSSFSGIYPIGSGVTYSVYFDGELAAKKCYDTCPLDQDLPFPELRTGAYEFNLYTKDLDGDTSTENASTNFPAIQIQF